VIDIDIADSWGRKGTETRAGLTGGNENDLRSRAADCKGTLFIAVVHVPGPCIVTLLILLFEPSMLTDTRPEYGYWAMMWIVAKVGFFVWVLRQLLRYAVFHWMTKLRKAISYSQPNSVAPVTNQGVGVRESCSNVTNNLAKGNSAPRAATNVEITGEVNQEDGRAQE